MKKIPLRVLPDPQMPNDPLAEIRTVDLIRQVIRQPLDKQKGADIEEIRKGIRLLDAIDALPNGNVLELEDSDYDHLKEKVIAMQWGVVDKRLLRVVDDILEATDVVTLNHTWDVQAAAARELAKAG